jgi:xanthine dehydrogenase accessory factor
MKDGSLPGPDPLVAIGDVQETPGLDAIRAFAAATARGEGVALVTVVGAEGSVPRGMGAAMMVRRDGTIVGTVGGGNLELLMIDHAGDAIADGRARRYRYDFTGGPERNIEKSCVGRSEFFIQPGPSRPRLHLFGAGHIGVALAPMAHAAGFDVTVIDDRPDHAPLESFGDEIRTLNLPFADAVAQLDFDDETYLVIVTYGHATDAVVLRECLGRPWRYAGMIGSKAKAGRVRRELGVDDATKKRLEELHSPIGLSIGGREPGEVAVSIVAELVAERHRDRDSHSEDS